MGESFLEMSMSANFIDDLDPLDALRLSATFTSARAHLRSQADSLVAAAFALTRLNLQPRSLREWRGIWSVCAESMQDEGWGTGAWAHSFHSNALYHDVSTGRVKCDALKSEDLKELVDVAFASGDIVSHDGYSDPKQLKLSSILALHVSILHHRTSRSCESFISACCLTTAGSYAVMLGKIADATLDDLTSLEWSLGQREKIGLHVNMGAAQGATALCLDSCPGAAIRSMASKLNCDPWSVDGGGRLVLCGAEGLASYNLSVDSPVRHSSLLPKDLHVTVRRGGQKRVAPSGHAYSFDEFLMQYGRKHCRAYWTDAPPCDTRAMALAEVLSSGHRCTKQVEIGSYLALPSKTSTLRGVMSSKHALRMETVRKRQIVDQTDKQIRLKCNEKGEKAVDLVWTGENLQTS